MRSVWPPRTKGGITAADPGRVGDRSGPPSITPGPPLGATFTSSRRPGKRVRPDVPPRNRRITFACDLDARLSRLGALLDMLLDEQRRSVKGVTRFVEGRHHRGEDMWDTCDDIEDDVNLGVAGPFGNPHRVVE